MFNRCCLVLLFCSCLLHLVAQEKRYNFSHLDGSTGLSNNQVNTLLRDKQGFLWVGTMSGLNRYDGRDIKIFRHKPGDSTSIVNSFVSALFGLPNNRIWVATKTLPCIYNSETEQFEADYSSWLRQYQLPVDSLIRSKNGATNRFWFLFDSSGLFWHNTNTRSSGRLAQSQEGKITDMHELPNGAVWLVYNNGLLEKRDANNGKLLQTSNRLSIRNPGVFDYRLFADSKENLWLYVANSRIGLFYFRQPTMDLMEINERSSPLQLNNSLITGVIEDDAQHIWVSTDHGGVNLLFPEQSNVTYLRHDPSNPQSLAQNSILTMYRDAAGMIWLGTYKQGLSQYNPHKEQFDYVHHLESVKQSLPFDDVNRFVEDANGNLWIGTNGGGLIYFDRKNRSFRQFLHEPGNSNSIGNNVVVSLCIDHTNTLWIGTYFGGLTSFDGNRFTHYKPTEGDSTSLSDDRVWEIMEDRQNRLWVGTLAGGLNLFDRKTSTFKRFQKDRPVASTLVDNYIAAIMQDKNGQFWIATALGITVWNRDLQVVDHFQRQENNPDALADNNVTCLLEDRQGRIWAGTRDGLHLYIPETKKFRLFTMADGLPDNSILTITEDKLGFLWISTPNGLCKMDAGTGYAPAIQITTYDASNNLQGREFNENAALLTRDGLIVVGGPNGFNMIHPAAAAEQQPVPELLLTELQILNEPVAVGEQINGKVLLPVALSALEQLQLSYKENVFSLSFAALDFSGSSNRYAYRLEGFSDEWLYADPLQRKVTYTNLDPGSYQFEVKALNNRGQWSAVRSLNIHISPPWWRTGWAFVLYALVAAAALWLGRRFVLERARMRFAVQQQQREAARIQAIDRLKTKFFTNVSHEFRTPLSLILAPLEKLLHQTAAPEQKKQLQLIHRNARRLLNLVNQLLDFRKMEVEAIHFHPAVGDIVGFAREIAYSFSDIAEKKQITLQFEADFETLEMYFDKDKMEKILFNLLSNAYKYTPDSGMVQVRLKVLEADAPILEIQVEDSGIGIPTEQQERIFERFFQSDLPGDLANQGTGIGLAITKEFVKLHQGEISVRSKPNEGACFTVQLPIRKLHTAAGEPIKETIGVPTETDTVETVHPSSRGKKKILVVEDNDDLRFYLKDNLQMKYQVLEAVNGQQGWELVNSAHPDLVVSDIMMPELSGIELARRIKTQTPTAHIPIILLTAMGSEAKQLEGFAIGVNDYITKPFTFELLASRIHNLLEQQKRFQRKFQNQLAVEPGAVTVTPLDEAFLQQAISVVEQQIDRPEFSVEDLSKELNMSRVALYKKILSLTGKPPLEFIRTIRMKRAAQLLGAGKTVAEIAYEVGFNNPKLFARYFKEEFGVIPSKYKQTDT